MSRSQSGRHRPHRGHPGPNVLVSGDPGSTTGVSRDPQGGARDVRREGPSESGDYASRVFGVPQADLPGGVKHLVNPQTFVDSPGPKPQRPADYHKEHGVEPIDWGQYVTPPDESEHYPALRPVPEIQVHDAVPVYLEQHPQKRRVIRTAVCFNVNVRPNTQEPSRICNRDPNRMMVLLLNEDTTNDVRVSSGIAELQLALGAGAAGSADEGALILHNLNSYTKIETQDQMFAIGTSSSSVRLSVILVTEIPETAGIE